MKNSITYILLLLSISLFGQLPNGTTAPDWTVIDLDGNSHNLYDVLEDGKSVIIDFSASWCGNCWNYHKTNALENVNSLYGPMGTDVTRVYWMDADASTNDACITNSAGCNNSTVGDWTANSNYTYINLEGPELSVKTNYNINSFPTIIGISSNKKQYEIGSVTNASVWNSWINETFALDYNGVVNGNTIDLTVIAGSGTISYLWSNGTTTQDIDNLSPGIYTCTITEGRGHSIETEAFEIIQNIVTVTCPNEIDGSLYCNASELPQVSTFAEFIQNEGEITGNYIESTFLATETSSGASCPELVTRVYSVQDATGQVFSCSQVITLSDEVSPNTDNFSFPTLLITESEITGSIYTELSQVPNFEAITDNCSLDENSFALITEVISPEVCTNISRVYIISDICGNTSAISQSIFVLLGEDAEVTYNTSSSNLLVEFESSSNFSGNSYSWNFGDSNVSTEKNPTHLYSAAGTYNICLSVSSPCGNKTYCADLEVKLSSATIICPTAIDGSLYCDASELPQITTLSGFLNNKGDILGQYIASSFMVEESIEGTCPQLVTRKYSVQDINGQTIFCTQEISIDDDVAPDLSQISIPKTLISESEFETNQYTEINQIPGFETITDNCGVDENSLFVSMEFSDQSICQSVLRVYTISDNCGNTSSFTEEFFIKLGTNASISFEKEINELEVKFDGSDNFEGTSYEWNFGDNATISNEKNPVHQYFVDGIYNVCVTASSPCGDKTFCEEIEVKKLVGISEFSNFSFEIYPNPVSINQEIIVNLGNKIASKISILDYQGVLKMEQSYSDKTEKNTIILSNFSAGLYFVVVENDQGHRSIQKLVIN